MASETTATQNGTPILANGNDISVLREKRFNLFNSKCTVVLGAQWGDEGKGKVVDMLATDVDIVCRCQVSKKNPKYFFLLQYFTIKHIVYLRLYLYNRRHDAYMLLYYNR